jgi:hypothetical protein
MTWKTVRLEFARSATFPSGTPSRAYLLRVPLDENGLIDGATLAQTPSRATAQRFWSSEPDQFGYLECSDGSWILRCRGQAGESRFRMPAVPLRVNGEITIEEPDGTSNPFRVASIKNVGPAVSARS